MPDDDGDYLMRSEGAPLYARVDGDRVPVVRVYSVLLNEIDGEPDLLAAINDVNTQLTFSRAFWANGAVMIEAEHLGLSLDPEDLVQAIRTVASASDHFGPQLAARFAGEQTYEHGKDDTYRAQPTMTQGYL